MLFVACNVEEIILQRIFAYLQSVFGLTYGFFYDVCLFFADVCLKSCVVEKFNYDSYHSCQS